MIYTITFIYNFQVKYIKITIAYNVLIQIKLFELKHVSKQCNAKMDLFTLKNKIKTQIL